MKSWASIRATFIVALAIAAVAIAGQPARTVSSHSDASVWQVADATQRFNISGTVEAVNYTSNMVTVKSGGQNVEIVVTPTTVVDEHGETGSIADIRKGAKISASGVIRSGRKVATSIVLK